MKILYPIFAILIFSMVLISCDSTESNSNDPNVINGETNIGINTVGNTFGASVKVGNDYINVADSVYIVSNNNGLITMKVKADLTQVPGLDVINNAIPSNYKDQNGKINVDVQFKSTSEGIQDYNFFNKSGKYHTIAKFNAKVGDTYPLKKSDGIDVVRTVAERTDQDDFPYGFNLIKTIKIEEDPKIPGIKKITYRVNHRFGLVWFEITMEDNSKASSYFYTNYTN
ncbi:MAG: hypothetical protein Q8M94_14335 [Ignavibacteria bacterium]|nr:hypothetical protein [Ignavibacteria bacterium]